jgi:PTS system ascorbate-specific IIA component
MSAGLIIITHDGIGPALLGTTKLMLQEFSLKTKLLTASRDCEPDELAESALEQIKALDEGDGVLILTDLYGSTPCNIAQKFSGTENIRIVTGLNLSMLIRVFNYSLLDLDELAEKAVSGGKDGILEIKGK